LTRLTSPPAELVEIKAAGQSFVWETSNDKMCPQPIRGLGHGFPHIIQTMEILSRIQGAIRHIAAAIFWVIRRVFQLTKFLLRLPALSLSRALLSDRTGIASILTAILVLASFIQTCLDYSPAVIVAVCTGIVVLQILLFRAFLWVYKPEVRIKSFVLLAAAIGLVVALLRAFEFTLGKVKQQAPDGNPHSKDTGTDIGQDDRKTQLMGIHVARRLMHGVFKLIPRTRGQLFPLLMASWLGLTTLVIFVYGICFYSLAGIGIPVLVFSGGSGCFWCGIAASLAIFTTTPISNVALTNAWGLFICGVEVADALLLLGLFLALLIRLVPHDSARGLEKIEAAVKKLNEATEARLELASKEFDKRVMRGDINSPTQHEPPSQHDGDSLS